MVEIGGKPILWHIMKIYLDTLRDKLGLEEASHSEKEAWHSENPPWKVW